MVIYHKFSVVMLFCMSFIYLAGQNKNVTKQGLYWIRYYNQLKINGNWSWHNEIDNRRFFKENQQHHLIMHTRMHFKISENANIAAGLTYSLQSPHEINPSIDLVIPEIRPLQEINYNIAISRKFTVQQRFRVDERFIRRNDGFSLLNSYDFNFRFRYRLQASYLMNKQKSKTNTTLKVANELMVNAGKKIVYNQFDQNRIYMGIEQDLTKNFTFELGYMHWYQQRNTGYQFFDRDIMRITIYHKLNI